MPRVGTVSTTAIVAGRRVTPDGGGYAGLKRQVMEAGLLEAQPRYYVGLTIVNSVLFGACLAIFFVTGRLWIVLPNAVVLALISGQLGFQLHDAGHHQMFRVRWKNTAVGFVTANLLLGMSYGWWVQKHNRHHANPNHVVRDPDIQNPAIAYTQEQALGRWGPLRLLARYQAFLFFPLLGLLAWSMHVAGAAFLARRRSHRCALEALALLAHAAAYVGVLVFALGPWKALLVVAVHKAVGGFYLASVFAPNHKGMPQTDDDHKLDFLRSQVVTSRNIRGAWWTDLLFGSLNYQVEHHLFPRMPRNRLRRSSGIVRAFCVQHGVPYHETSFLGSYSELLRFLHGVGAPLRSPARPVS